MNGWRLLLFTMILAQDVVRISKLKSSLSEMYDNVNTSQFCFSLLYGIRFLSFQIYKKCCQHFMERKYVTILSPPTKYRQESHPIHKFFKSHKTSQIWFFCLQTQSYWLLVKVNNKTKPTLSTRVCMHYTEFQSPVFFKLFNSWYSLSLVVPEAYTIQTC